MTISKYSLVDAVAGRGDPKLVDEGSSASVGRRETEKRDATNRNLHKLDPIKIVLKGAFMQAF